MISVDRTAWICDLAETYHLYDWRSLPLSTVAALSAGLRDNSRIKKKIRGDGLPDTDNLLGQILDMLIYFAWSAGGYGDIDKAPSIFGDYAEERETAGNVAKYSSAEEFESAWNA